MNNSTNYFQEKLETLPDHLRWAIREVDYMKELAEIKKKHKLHIDQASTLEMVAQRLILGDIDAAAFVNTLFKEAYVSSQAAADILVDIDQLILKKIREKIESFEQEELEVQRHRDQYRTDDEVEIDELNTIYRQQDEEYVKVKQEVEEQLNKEGFLPDGSNVTDEDIARAYGMTLAEYLAQNKADTTEVATTGDIVDEKEELLRELESPKKSFTTPIFTGISKPVAKKLTTAPITPPDHQLQNTHVEQPYHDDINPPIEPTKAVETVHVDTTVVTPTTVTPSTKIANTPIIKKPAKIDLGHDIYREPIE